MPTCIYCMQTKQSVEFSREHVLTRAFCGTGDNWTLVDAVCSECNGLFSRFESHWTRSAIESIMRSFSAPSRQGRKLNVPRRQPIESDDIYLVQRNDPLVYEAGFAVANDFYFRPQIVQSNAGLVCLASNREEERVLKSEIALLIKRGHIEISSPSVGQDGRTFKVARLAIDMRGKRCFLLSEREEQRSFGYWLRPYPPGRTVKGFSGVEGELTPRCALDDRQRLYFRADGWSGVVDLLTDLLQNKTNKSPHQAESPHDQTVRIGVAAKLPLVFRAVLKTGLNLVAHSVGTSLAMDDAFDDLRRMLMENDADDELMRRCGFLDDSLPWLGREEFPSPDTTSQHRLMLDIYRGRLYFRIRLYGHLGYESVLAIATRRIQGAMTTERVIVDFESSGFRRVPVW